MPSGWNAWSVLIAVLVIIVVLVLIFRVIIPLVGG